MTQPEDVHPLSFLPVLGNLSHLELGLVTIEVILVLLSKSPVLKTLVLKVGIELISGSSIFLKVANL
jgi:hypothetical protein